MTRPSWAPPEIDLNRPSAARVYDYYLGGFHNFPADRAMAQEAIRHVARAAGDDAGEPGVPAPGHPIRGGPRDHPVPGHRLGHSDGGQLARGRAAGEPGVSGGLRRH